jgi:gas vesicle protein
MKRLAKGMGVFAAGVAAGGAMALLVTPKTGRAMRKSIARELRHGRNSATCFARNVAGDVRSAYDSGRGKLRTLTGSFHVA